MAVIRIKNKRQKARFASTGAVATSIDFAILFFLHSLGVFSIAANFVSTTSAFGLSFVLNKKYTFKSSGNTKRQLLLYFITTFFGLWAIQPVIIWTCMAILSSSSLAQWQTLFIGKLIATGTTLIWNYFLYSRVVFPKHTRKDAA